MVLCLKPWAKNIEITAMHPAPTSVTNIGFFPAKIFGVINQIKIAMLTNKPTTAVIPRTRPKLLPRQKQQSNPPQIRQTVAVYQNIAGLVGSLKFYLR